MTCDHLTTTIYEKFYGDVMRMTFLVKLILWTIIEHCVFNLYHVFGRCDVAVDKLDLLLPFCATSFP